jgi:ABC-type glycerol-3-phosphate transport system permease component
VLITGALVFALPYGWLVGTSFKLDKEVRSADFRIFPQKPVPSPVSPYIDVREFQEITQPEQVAPADWEGWMKRLIQERIDQAIDAWDDPAKAGLDEGVLRSELRQGVFARLVNLLGDDLQLRDEDAFDARLDAVLNESLVSDAFAGARRFFALGTVRLVTQDYRVFDLTKNQPLSRMEISDGAHVTLTPVQQGDREIVKVDYDFAAGDTLRLTTAFQTPVNLDDPATGFKRIEFSFHADQTWHDLRVFIEMGGRRYRSAEPKYLGDDQWTETLFQLPGPDDDRLAPKRYILLKEVDEGGHLDNGDGVMNLEVTLERSNQLEAWWAKCTENYRRAFDEVPFWRYFKTSAFLVLANILGTLLSCSLAAYAFARLNWPGRDICFVLVLATLMIPPQVTMIPSFVIYKHLGWYNTLAPLWVPNCLALNGFGIFLLRQAMKGIPKDLEEAAKIDGCSHLRIYWSIILPLVRPTLAAISIFTFMFVWNDFLGPLIYVNDQRLYPLALGLFSFMVGRENQFTLIMAGSMIMTLPVIITFFLAQRYFIQGVTMSGMKQ